MMMPEKIDVVGVKDRIGATGFTVAFAKYLSGAGCRLCLVNNSFPKDLQRATRAEFVRDAHEVDTFLKVASKQRLHGYLSRFGEVPLVDICGFSAWDKVLEPVFIDLFRTLLCDCGSNVDKALEGFGAKLIVTLDDEGFYSPLKDKISKLITGKVTPESIAVVINSRSEDAKKRLLLLCRGVKVFLADEFEQIFGFVSSVQKENASQTLTGSELCSMKARLIDIVVNAPELKNRAQQRDELNALATQIAATSLASISPGMDAGIFKKIVKEVVEESLGLGPIDEISRDSGVTEIMVNSCNEIFVERNGVIEKSGLSFANSLSLGRAIERIVAPVGRRVDESSPMADARLSDGSRVNIILPPVSLNGPVVTIRRFAASPAGIETLLKNGSLSAACAKYLEDKVALRANILVSGGTGSGKTTLLNVLSSFIDPRERIICVEDSSELRFEKPHVVRLEARPPNIEGGGEITIRDLVRNAMRMRPDRIIVGECRSGEALDMLQAMNTGHSGSMTTIHANSARDSLSRLETLAMFAKVDLPVSAIRRQIASAISVVVHLERKISGARGVAGIVELCGLERDEFVLNEVKLT